MIKKHCPQYEMIYAFAKYNEHTEGTFLILCMYDEDRGRWFNAAKFADIYDTDGSEPARGLAQLTRSLDYWLGLDDSAFCWAVSAYFSALKKDFDEGDLLGYPDAAQYDDFQLVRSVRAEFDGDDGLDFVDQIKEMEGEHYAE